MTVSTRSRLHQQIIVSSLSWDSSRSIAPLVWLLAVTSTVDAMVIFIGQYTKLFVRHAFAQLLRLMM